MNWSDWAATGLSSTVIEAGDGRRWRLVLSLPPGETPAEGWPLLWALDGDQHGLTLIETARRLGRRSDATGVPPLAVAALMGAEEPLGPADRHHVFTPGLPADPAMARGGWEPGGAEALSDLLTGRAAATVRAAGAVDTARPMIWGHSLSAYFALWMAGQTGGAVGGVAAISPSLWWGEEGLTPSEARVYLAAGGREDRPDERGMVRRMQALAGRLDAAGTPAALRIFEGEDHGSIVSASVADALRHLAGSAAD